VACWAHHIVLTLCPRYALPPFLPPSPPPLSQREVFTRVLKGHIALQSTPFPCTGNISGTMLDSLARQALWRVGLDYNHGTGLSP